MTIKITTVDSFTDRPFRGNPAAVCILEAPRPESWMQDVAREMNLSETAFLHPRGDAYALRWFTPTAEVDLCGHATLASAHVLWEEKRLDRAAHARFETKSGLLTCRRERESILMDFPSEPPTESSAPDGLESALGIKALWVGRNRLDYLVLADSAGTVRTMAPDFTRLATIHSRGVIVTAVSDSKEFDFVSRYFAPQFGILEDPATGSTHCCLGPYWGARLGKNVLTGYQASARGGIIGVSLAGPRVVLSGRAVTVLRATLAG